jgi:hypothetical protein
LHAIKRPPLDSLTAGIWDRLGVLSKELKVHRTYANMLSIAAVSVRFWKRLRHRPTHQALRFVGLIASVLMRIAARPIEQQYGSIRELREHTILEPTYGLCGVVRTSGRKLIVHDTGTDAGL